MAITPSSRWISKDESDEDSVPFEKSKKAGFQISFVLDSPLRQVTLRWSDSIFHRWHCDTCLGRITVSHTDFSSPKKNRCVS